jgi:Fuc2NAc and GlcNAc transferase
VFGFGIWLVAILGAVCSILLTGYLLRYSLSRGHVDVPNARSSHTIPTPRGGGLAIVVVSLAGFLLLFWTGSLDGGLALALLAGGAGVAAIGYIDDRRPLRAGARLAVHIACAVLALAAPEGPLVIQIGEGVTASGAVAYVLGTLGIVWTLNLFNFMDGIDGIAASEAVFVAWAGALLSVLAGIAGGIPEAALIFGAACLGFLRWNWAPARIFMGDVGSGYLGFVVAVLAVAAARQSPSALFVWLILGGSFFVDASVTLVRRCLRLEPPHKPHRSHAYQWLARRWSHKRATLAFIATNVLWLAPLAWLAAVRPQHAGWIAAAALGPLIMLALVAGAGRPEVPAPQ